MNKNKRTTNARSSALQMVVFISLFVVIGGFFLRSSFAAGGAPVVSVVATPNPVISGQSTTLSWYSNPTGTCSDNLALIHGGASSGSVSYTVSSNFSWTVTCTNSYGSGSNSVNVTLSSGPAHVTLSAKPTTISGGQKTILTWTISGASQPCGKTDNATDPKYSDPNWSGTTFASGSQSVSPSVTDTYEISCYANLTWTHATAIVTVNNSSPSPGGTSSPPPPTTGSASNTSAKPNQSSGTNSTKNGTSASTPNSTNTSTEPDGIDGTTSTKTLVNLPKTAVKPKSTTKSHLKTILLGGLVAEVTKLIKHHIH